MGRLEKRLGDDLVVARDRGWEGQLGCSRWRVWFGSARAEVRGEMSLPQSGSGEGLTELRWMGMKGAVV